MKTLTIEQMGDLMTFIRVARERVAPGLPRFDQAYKKAYAVFWPASLLAASHTALPSERATDGDVVTWRGTGGICVARVIRIEEPEPANYVLWVKDLHDEEVFVINAADVKVVAR